MLPQVLAGLGVFSLVSAGCFYWLERLQPVFFTIALLALAYEIWLINTLPGARRSGSVRAMLAFSAGLNVIVAGAWILLLLRYR